MRVSAEGAAPPAGTESLASAAGRWGRSATHVGNVLAAAGVYRRGRQNVGGGGLRLRVEDVDRAMRATGAAPRAPRGPGPSAPPAARAPAVPPHFAEVDPATGLARWCESCAATRACGARLMCRWCAEGKPPLRYDEGASP